MAKIHTLKKNGESIYPMTHIKGVVDDNGNTMDVLLAEAEKRALRKLYIAAGALYNDTDEVIKRTAFWGEEVDHLPKHYYLNGLGDITEEQMLEIYKYKDYMTMYISVDGINRFFQNGLTCRTLFPYNAGSARFSYRISIKDNCLFSGNNFEVIKWNNTGTWSNNVYRIGLLFHNTQNLRIIDKFVPANDERFYFCYALKEARVDKLQYNLSFEDSPKISKESILFAINNFVVPTTAASTATNKYIKLHKNSYPILSVDEDILSAINAKNEELSPMNWSLSLVSA